MEPAGRFARSCIPGSTAGIEPGARKWAVSVARTRNLSCSARAAALPSRYLPDTGLLESEARAGCLDWRWCSSTALDNGSWLDSLWRSCCALHIFTHSRHKKAKASLRGSGNRIDLCAECARIKLPLQLLNVNGLSPFPADAVLDPVREAAQSLAFPRDDGWEISPKSKPG